MSDALLTRARDVASSALAMIEGGSSASEGRVLHLIRRLATVVGDLLEVSEDASPAPDGAQLVVGATYEMLLRVKATVVETSDSHGQCYALSLEPRDYVASEGVRSVCVDADEIMTATRSGDQ